MSSQICTPVLTEFHQIFTILHNPAHKVLVATPVHEVLYQMKTRGRREEVAGMLVCPVCRSNVQTFIWALKLQAKSCF